MNIAQASAAHHVENATCLACGCMCDDVRLTAFENRITRADGACPVGQRWFLAERPRETAGCQLEGRPASVEDGLRRAASLLCGARHVLVWGLTGATCEAQRAAVSLADRLGASVDAGSSASARLSRAIESAGMVTATLGEVRHRADLVIFWDVDPATTHPRHLERYSLSCAGEFTPRGRGDRLCVVVSSERTATARAADLFLHIHPHAEAAALKTLRLLAGDGEAPDAEACVQQTGIALQTWRELMQRMKAAKYGAVFFEPDAATEALLLLTRDMNRHTRMVALPLGGPGNPAGAHQVLAWQTGYSSPVDFAAGYPRHNRETPSAEALMEGADVDAVLVVAQDPLADPFAGLSESSLARLAEMPSVVLHTSDCRPPFEPSVELIVATPGVEAGGSVFRSDGVALPLRPAIRSAYADAERLLSQLEQCVRHTLAAQRG